MRRGCAARLGLAAQVADVDVERVRAEAEVVAPDALEDDRAGQHLARVAQEQLEQRGTRCASARSARRRGRPRACRGSSSRSAKRELLAPSSVAPRRRSARSRASSSSSANGFDEVVVGARVEPGDAVVHLAARGEHEDRHARCRPARSAAADLEAVERGHQSRRGRPRPARRRCRARSSASAPSVGELDLVALELERAPQRFAHRGIVVHDQDLRSSRSIVRANVERTLRSACGILRRS